MPHINIINNDLLGAVKTLKKIMSKEYIKELKMKSFFVPRAKKRKLKSDLIIKRKIESKSQYQSRPIGSQNLKVYTDYEKESFLLFDQGVGKIFDFKRSNVGNSYKKTEVSPQDLQALE